jgi:hypothetical protein
MDILFHVTSLLPSLLPLPVTHAHLTLLALLLFLLLSLLALLLPLESPVSRLTLDCSDHPNNEDVSFLHGLLKWFKRDFFKWCNKPECATPQCGGKGPSIEGMGAVQSSGECCANSTD